MSDIYGYPELGRFGLGHSLLAWARCVVWCRAKGARMLGPLWLRLRIGPYLRRERDKREYFKLFNNRGYVGEPTRSYRLLTARKIAAEEAATIPDLAAVPGPTIVVFSNSVSSNFEKHFHEVAGYGPDLHQELRRITHRRYLPCARREPFVAAHVRLGDFSRFDQGMIDTGRHNLRLPIHWYCDAITALRDGLGLSVPVRVYSDGHTDELAPLLDMQDVQRAEDAESITHMLEMARASAIISAGSGFSLWSAFFGQVPRITYPKQSIVAVNEDPTLEESHSPGESLTMSLVGRVRERLMNTPVT